MLRLILSIAGLRASLVPLRPLKNVEVRIVRLFYRLVRPTGFQHTGIELKDATEYGRGHHYLEFLAKSTSIVCYCSCLR